jgi:amino acid transporter
MIIVSGFIFGKKANISQVPYSNGFSGIVKGSSIVLYAYLGFESSTCAILETKNPKRNVPLSMIISLGLVSCLYSLSAFSVNLMQPYNELVPQSTFQHAFKNIPYLNRVIQIGPIISLTGSLLTSMYSIGRIIYVMSSDGLLFKVLNKVHNRFKIPYNASLTSLIICILLIIFVDKKHLIGYVDICGFFIYSTVSACLLFVRYSTNDLSTLLSSNEVLDSSNEFELDTNLIEAPLLEATVSTTANEGPKRFRSTSAMILISTNYCSNFFLSLIYHHLINHFSILLIIISVCFLSILILLLFCKQNESFKNYDYSVPLVQVIPFLSISINMFLMMSNSLKDLLLFKILILIGLLLYFLYGMRNSNVANNTSNNTNQEE